MNLSDAIRLACVWEATARKPGNVHPEASFSNLTWQDFVDSAEAAAPSLALAAYVGVGDAVRNAVYHTRLRVKTNTNLGIALLLAPLAAVPAREPLSQGIWNVLRALTVDDAAGVYEAIRIAKPAGMGKVEDQDVSEEPTETLRQVMARAADRDLIARQYTTDFALVFSGARQLAEAVSPKTWGISGKLLPELDKAIIRLHVQMLATHPDSLIVRKCGEEVGRETSRRAAHVLKKNLAPHELERFDKWLRADGHQRNPGTTADLIVACLFVCLRDLA